jgi:hypothetical protein
VPEQLNEEQQGAVEALAKTLDGNPRARLFQDAQAGHGNPEDS